MRTYGASVNMTRGVEIARFSSPVFSLACFPTVTSPTYPGPPFGFLGRVHTNGNLYLTPESPRPAGARRQAHRSRTDSARPPPQQLPGQQGERVFRRCLHCYQHQRLRYICGQPGRRQGGAAPAGCVNWGPDTDNATDDSSWSGGIPTPNGWANTTSFTGTISPKTFNSFAMIGVPLLQLPFVQGAAMGPQTRRSRSFASRKLSPSYRVHRSALRVSTTKRTSTFFWETIAPSCIPPAAPATPTVRISSWKFRVPKRSPTQRWEMLSLRSAIR